jgi:type IV pilus assembly protein PilA
MLARIRKSMAEKDQGFTLIELLVVMIIIGILAAIAIPVFLNQRKRAVDSSIKSDLRAISNQMETFFTDNQAYVAPTQTNPGDAVLMTGGDSVKVSGVNDFSFVLLTSAGAVTTDASVATGYCITGTSTKGSTAVNTYNSQSGGLSSTACPT